MSRSDTPSIIPDTLAQLLGTTRSSVDAAAPLLAPPTNDMCAGAEVIPGSGPFPYVTNTTSVLEATEAGDPTTSCTGSVNKGLWYTFTPTTSGSYRFSTLARGTSTAFYAPAPTLTSNIDTVIAIYTAANGCGSAYSQLTCNDDAGALGQQSEMVATLTAGTQYYILVWNYSTTTPTFPFSSVQLYVNQNPISNDVCANATPLLLGVPVPFYTAASSTNNYQLTTGAACWTAAASGVGNSPVTAPGRDAVFSFTAPEAGSYSFRLYNGRASNSTTAPNMTLYLTPGGTCPTGATTIDVSASCVAAANRTSGESVAEEIKCYPMTAGQQVNIYADEGASTAVGYGAFVQVRQCSAETEPNGTTATASALAWGIQGAITTTADVDFYALGSHAAGSRVFATVDGAASNSSNFDLRVTTAADTLEYDNNDNQTPFGASSPGVAGTILPNAPAFLRVNNGSSTISDPYLIYAVVQPPSSSAIPEIEPNNFYTQASADASNYFTGTLSVASDADFYSFTAGANNIVLLSLDTDPTRTGSPFNGTLALFNANGSLVTLVDDATNSSSTTTGAGTTAGTTPNSPAESIHYRVLRSGTYYVRVTGAAGDYLLSIYQPTQPGMLHFSSSATSSVSEGVGNAAITVNRVNGSSGQATVTYQVTNGSAIAPTDYVSSTGVLTFAEGETSQTIMVPIVDDGVDEANETVQISLSNASGASLGSPSSTVLTILDNDTEPSFSISDATTLEGNSGTTSLVFTVTLSAASGQSTSVTYTTADNTAVNSSDYVTATGVLSFMAGQISQPVTITINGDVSQEPDETLFVNLSAPVNATIADGQAVGTIVTDDQGGNNNILWDQLYHGASATTPFTETVPGQASTFLDVAGGGEVTHLTSVDLYMLTDYRDVASAQIRYWDGSMQHFVPMTLTTDVTVAFRGQPERRYDVWRGTIPPQEAGATVYYRLIATDGSVNAYLKAANGFFVNPLGQNIRGGNDDPDDYSYTVADEPTPSVTATPTETPTATATETATPSSTATATGEPSQTGTATPSSTATATGEPSQTATVTTTPVVCQVLQVPLSGAQEVPPNNSPATGLAIIEIDTVSNELRYNISYSGILTETNAHIHGFAPPGTTAGVLHELPATNPKMGIFVYNQANEANILAGLTYINIHSSMFQGGEIRGQIAGVGMPCPGTPTATATATATATGTASTTATASVTPSATTSATASATVSATTSATASATASVTATEQVETPTVTATVEACTVGDTDVDDSGKTDIVDIQITAAHFGETGTGIQGDINCDGDVDIADISEAADAWQ